MHEVGIPHKIHRAWEQKGEDVQTQRVIARNLEERKVGKEYLAHGNSKSETRERITLSVLTKNI